MKRRVGRLTGMVVCLISFVVLLSVTVKAAEGNTEISSLVISDDGKVYGTLYGAPYSDTDDSQWLTLKLGGRGLRIVDENNTDVVLIDQFGSVYIGGELCNPVQTEKNTGIKTNFSYGFMYFLVVVAILLSAYNFVTRRKS